MRNGVGRMLEQGSAGTKENKRSVELVCEGGGVKGIGLFGA